MDKPIKMYCNFQEKIPKGYYLQSGVTIKNVNIRKKLGLQSPVDYLKVCGKAGLNVASVKSVEDINNIVQLSFEQS